MMIILGIALIWIGTLFLAYCLGVYRGYRYAWIPGQVDTKDGRYTGSRIHRE